MTTPAPLESRPSTSPADFISQRRVFRLDELRAEYRAMGRKPSAAHDTVAYHLGTGRLVVVRRGVYTHAECSDPPLIASKLTADAVLSHEGALLLRGLALDDHGCCFLTATRTGITRYAGCVYQPIRVAPSSLWPDVETLERSGQALRATTLERTYVDCLTRLDRSPPPEHLLKTFVATAPTLDVDRILFTARRSGSPLVTSRVAFFLACARSALTRKQAQHLERDGVQVPTYFLRSARTKNDALISPCNLIISAKLRRFWTGA